MFEKIENTALRRRVKNNVIGRPHDYFAVVQPSFEEVAAAELLRLGITPHHKFIEGGLEFTGRLDSCYRACFLSRTASRVIMRTGEFRSANFFELERAIRNFPWELYIFRGTVLKFRASTAKSMIYHTGKLEEIFAAGIDSRLNSDGVASGVTGVSGTQTVFLRNHRDSCTVSLDASGEFLYKRSGDKHVTSATLRETTASLILFAAGIEGYEQVLDPMCGSGTFSIEAASIFTNTPPGSEREFRFMNWPCFREGTFGFIKNSALKNVIPQDQAKARIFTYDSDPAAVRIAAANVPVSMDKMIQPEVRDFFSLSPGIVKGKKTLLVLNPPYGKRLGGGNEPSLFREIGRKIRKDFRACGYAVIVPGHAKEKALGLNHTRRINFINGGIRVSLFLKDI